MAIPGNDIYPKPKIPSNDKEKDNHRKNLWCEVYITTYETCELQQTNEKLLAASYAANLAVEHHDATSSLPQKKNPTTSPTM